MEPTTATTRKLVVDAIHDFRLILVFRGINRNTRSEVAYAIDSGVQVIEFTLDDSKALDEIDYWRTNSSRIIGAGTVNDDNQARRAIEAGALFLVSPYTDGKVAYVANERQTLYIPGAFSPNEIRETVSLAGVNFVKVFPACSLTPRGFKAILTVEPTLRLIASGDIHPEEAMNYLGAGAKAVALASTRFSTASNHLENVVERMRIGEVVIDT